MYVCTCVSIVAYIGVSQVHFLMFIVESNYFHLSRTRVQRGLFIPNECSPGIRLVSKANVKKIKFVVLGIIICLGYFGLVPF